MRVVAYYRVSTQKQSASGLGLEAQRQAVQAFCQQRQCKMLAEYTEVESGKHDAREQLQAALQHAKLTNSTLLVAKLDRLSRNVAFLATLQDSGAKFIAVDNPEANELTVHILAAVAQAERKAISQRTKDALQAAKARGVKLGNPNGAAALRRAGRGNAGGAKAARTIADSYAASLRPLFATMQGQTLTSIAAKLNAMDIATARGGTWHASTVRNVMKRLG